jgi:GNAT superfamily N-acetyltransferase
MAIEIRLATTAPLRDAAYKLRYRVFAALDYQFGADSIHRFRFVDFWDTLDTTLLFVALEGGTVLATVRSVVQSEVGLPDYPYDFGPFQKTLPAGVATLMGRMATEPGRRGGGLGTVIHEVAFSYARARGVRYVFGLANTAYSAFWEELGFVWIDDALAGPGTGIELRPHVLDLEKMPPRLASRDFCAMARTFRDARRFLFLRKGETLARGEGETRDTAWEVVLGEVSVTRGPGEVSRHGPGSIVDALTTTAATDECVCVGMGGADLRQRLGDSPR